MCFSTIVCHSHIWVAEAERILTGWESCLLQGIPIDAFPTASQMGRRALINLAGDAFCGAAFAAVLIGVLTHQPALASNPEEHKDPDREFLEHLVWADE